MIPKEEIANILDILEKAKIAIEERNPVNLNELSNRTIHTASIEQDTDSILLAVIIYSLSKIIERGQYKELPGWNKFYSNYKLRIEIAEKALKEGDEEKFFKSLKEIQNSISNLSGSLKSSIKDVFQKARINKASKIYEHGISMEKTADLLGITLWELASYAGQKSDPESEKYSRTESAKARIKIAMEMFS